MTRKEFIRLCKSSCLAVMGLSLSEQALACVQEAEEGEILTVPKEKFAREKGGKTSYRKYITITSESREHPILIYRFDENDYAAILLKCTHRGAELNISGDMLTCPAHDSEFSLKGEVLQGPADEPLKTFPLSYDEQNIYINLA